MAATPPATARGYIWRSLAMLSTVRGPVAVSIVLGLIVSALPFVANAAFGPLMQAVADAGKAGNLAGVWALDGTLLSKDHASTSGFLGWLAAPLPFAVLLGIWAVSLVLAQVISFVNSWIDAQVQWKLLTEIRQRVHDHIQTLSLSFFTGTRSGALMQRVQMEAAGVQRLLTDCLIPPSVDGIVLVIALAYLFALSWQMTLVALVLSPLAMIALRFAGRRLQAATQWTLMSHRELGGELEETISGISEIQIFNAQQRRNERFHAASSSAARSTGQMLIWINAGTKGAAVFTALSSVLVLVVGIAFGGRFGLTFAGLLVFVGFVPTMFASVQRIMAAYTMYKSIAPNVALTYELLDTRPTIDERPDAEPLHEVRGNLVFEDVAFGYSPQQQIFDGLSFSVAEGETVALVGAIGSGKSTAFNLLLRFLDPQRGRILLDGHDIRQVTITSLREQVSKLAQFPFFMKDTIRENIRLARPDATDAEVEQACELAHIHTIIRDPTKIHNGYDTIVDAQVPSGGQKRLIAMSRCLLRKPEVLLLDEPTENLDNDQRTRMIAVIRGYAKDRTCIVISHDMDFIAGVADRIIVLGGGRVAEEGTHEELLTACGLYKMLYDAQNVEPSFVHGKR
jgi:ABC-type multidrug transport system fused ATPase/permease subunit